MKVLGIDYGEKRIGVAIGEMSVRLAFPRKSLKGSGEVDKDAEQISKLALDEECGLIVVGLPLLESGEEGEQARVSKELGAKLAAKGHSVTMWDERYTTAVANMNLVQFPTEKRKRLLDSEAARIMLVDFLAKGDV